MKLQVFILLALLLTQCHNNNETSWLIESPNQEVKVNLFFKNEAGANNLFYSVRSSSGTILEESPLGLQLNQNMNTSNWKLADITDAENVNERYNFITGKQSEFEVIFNQQKFHFLSDDNVKIDLHFKVYDDAVAFRYELPNPTNKAFELFSEATGFNLPKGKAWLTPHQEGYENFYHNGVSSDSLLTEEVGFSWLDESIGGFSFPALFEVSNQWVLLTEAGHNDNFYGSHIVQEASDHSLYICENPYDLEEGSAVLTINKPWESLWRVVKFGDLNSVATTDIVKTLNPQPNKNYDWIQPGRASWSWKRYPNSSRKSPEILRDFIDMGARMGWEHNLIDANWNELPPDTLQSLLAYAKEKNIGVWLWYNSGGPHNEGQMWSGTEAPRDKMHEKTVRRETLKKLQEWGVKGIKVDFFISDKADRMKQYIDILEDAADFEIMVNFHGCTLPRGWSYTYPHLLTMEAIRGTETYGAHNSVPADFPSYNTIVPFTRNVVGSADYTVAYLEPPKGTPRFTTAAHELANACVIESAVTHFADGWDYYGLLPDLAKKYLKVFPTVWDETKLLSGYPGKDIVLARRKGKRWFIGCLNGEGEDKILEIDFSKLGLSKSLKIEALFDKPGAKDSIETQEIEWDASKLFTINVAKHGGAVLML